MVLVYAEGRATREHILKIFAPYVINSDLWCHILKFASQRNLLYQITLVGFFNFLRDNYGKKLYLWNIIRTKMSALFRIPSQSNPSLKEQKSSIFSLVLSLRKCWYRKFQDGRILQDIPPFLYGTTQGKRIQDTDHGQTDHRKMQNVKL